MNYLFISRDSAEYQRYLRGASDRGFNTDSCRIYEKEISQRDSGKNKPSGNPDEVILFEPDDREEASYVNAEFHWRTIEGGRTGERIFVVNAKEPIDKWKYDLRSEEEKTRIESARRILKLLKDLEDKTEGKSAEEVTILIHFGEGAFPKDFEGPSEKAFNATDSGRKIQVLAVSSRRCDCFDVDKNRRDPIVVPIRKEGEDGLNALVGRFMAQRERTREELLNLAERIERGDETTDEELHAAWPVLLERTINPSTPPKINPKPTTKTRVVVLQGQGDANIRKLAEWRFNDPNLKNAYDFVFVEDWQDNTKPAQYLITNDAYFLILCEDRNRLRDKNVVCPSEFVLDMHDLLKDDSVDVLLRRLSCICGIYPVNRNQLLDWFLGVLRSYLYVSPRVHGKGGYIDLRKGSVDQQLQEWYAKDPDMFRQFGCRFHVPQTQDSSAPYQKLIMTLYPDIYNEFKNAFAKIFNPDFLRLTTAYGQLAEEIGDCAGYLTPTGKLRLLLIDDKAGQFATIINQKVGNYFKVTELEIKTNDPISETVRDHLRSAESYDLILIDLCLGEERGDQDLEGYGVIRIAKNFCPGTPIIVYSQYDDMGHIARAFREGATWFLKKGDEEKLPRHVLKILERYEWKREWSDADPRPEFQPMTPDQDEFADKLARKKEWAYLTWKCLEDFPGNNIFVEKMSGGLSTTATFKANKGVSVGRIPLQMPNIIKIDDQFRMMDEYERYSRFIRPYMANEAGRIEHPERAINRFNAAIVYTFAGKQDNSHRLDSMASLLREDLRSCSTCDYERYRFVVDHLFDDILPKIHRIAPDLEFKETIPDKDVTRPFGSNAFDPTENWDKLTKTSFPNTYFDEYLPSEFLSSYTIRFQPWYKLTLKEGYDSFAQEHVEGKTYGLIFHAVRKAKDESIWIEAHDKNGYLCRIYGNQAEYAAKYRKHIFPGDSLYVKMSASEIIECKDYRSEWLDSVRDEIAKARGVWKPIVTASWAACVRGMYGGFDLMRSGFNNGYAELQDSLIKLSKAVVEVEENWKKYECKCPVGIVHGDLNLNNVMLEALKHAPKEKAPDVTSTVTDAWLIDFARTRRDLIAHDFNVFFTSVLGELLSRYDIDNTSGGEYRRLEENFSVLIRESVFGKAESLRAVPDALQSDERLTLVWKLLYRCRQAAIESGISENMYILTTALGCMVAQRIFFEKGEIVKSAGFFTAAAICRDEFAARITPKKTAP